MHLNLILTYRGVRSYENASEEEEVKHCVERKIRIKSGCESDSNQRRIRANVWRCGPKPYHANGGGTLLLFCFVVVSSPDFLICGCGVLASA